MIYLQSVSHANSRIREWKEVEYIIWHRVSSLYRLPDTVSLFSSFAFCLNVILVCSSDARRSERALQRRNPLLRKVWLRRKSLISRIRIRNRLQSDRGRLIDPWKGLSVVCRIYKKGIRQTTGSFLFSSKLNSSVRLGLQLRRRKYPSRREHKRDVTHTVYWKSDTSHRIDGWWSEGSETPHRWSRYYGVQVNVFFFFKDCMFFLLSFLSFLFTLNTRYK